jgi:hypothetical protein
MLLQLAVRRVVRLLAPSSVLLKMTVAHATQFQPDGFRHPVLPFFKQHCVSCHNAKEDERWLEAEKPFVIDPDSKPVAEATLLGDDRVISGVRVKPGNATTAMNQVYTLLTWSSGGTLNAHNNTDLPTMLVGGHKLGIKHQGHLDKKDVRPGNLWQTMFGVLGVAVPKDFQGGEADGVIKELV